MIRLLFSLLLFTSHLCASDDPQNFWRLNIYDNSGQLTSNAVINLTKTPANACLDGKWFQVKVLEFNAMEAETFPFTNQLSYRFDGNKILLGRNNRCDSYAQLAGELNGNTISGSYFSFGLGWSKDLGTFSMSKVDI
ncbi:hypothetical protein [Alteromonas australica]|uniref:Uncharacterized protein n=1 Tax=Alteromonas australica TaxID=589873 RepID=A0A075NUB5_9ALTE|nr:hypothetical protein [Alteromonas australica]AIF98244.1 hypothetical protein EP13_05730 [Alteromonas australica]